MPKPLKSADELRALVESHLSDMSVQERKRFWQIMTEHNDNEHYRKVREFFLEKLQEIGNATATAVSEFTNETNELTTKLQRHRKPIRNAERDAEIMRLHGEGRTAGQIVNALAKQYKLTDKSVNAVIWRQNRKQKIKG